MSKDLYKDTDWLQEQYWDRGLSMGRIGEIAGCASGTICYWMKKLGIKIRSRSQAAIALWGYGPYRDEGWLREQYLDKGLSAREIADIAGRDATAIDYWMRKFSIEYRSMSQIIILRWEHGVFGEECQHKKSETMRQHWVEGDSSLGNEEWRRKCSEGSRASWARGDHDGVFQSPTSIELQVAAALDIMGIEHESQHRPNDCRWPFDEFVPPNILIEVQGDYWHSLPEKQERDAEKAQWAEEHGFNLIAIWEHEIKAQGAWATVARIFFERGRRGLRR